MRLLCDTGYELHYNKCRVILVAPDGLILLEELIEFSTSPWPRTSSGFIKEWSFDSHSDKLK